MRTLIDRLEHGHGRHPERRLFEFRDVQGRVTERHTWRSLHERSQVVAAHLVHGLGMHRGDRVLLAYPPGLEAVAALLGCACAGLVGVPLPLPRTRDDAAWRRLCAAAQDCSATLLMGQGHTLARLRGLVAPGDGNAHPLPARWLDSRSLNDTVAPAATRLEGELFFLQYTSGSTGRARGVMVTHDNILANARASLDQPPIGVSWLPQHHDMGLIGYYLFPIASGGSSIGFAPEDFLRRPALWLRLISEVGATHTSSPNFGFEYCLRSGRVVEDDLQGVDLSTLRVLMNASEPVNLAITRAFHRRFARQGLRREACTSAYGLAEHTLMVTHGGRGGVRVQPGAGAALTLLSDEPGDDDEGRWPGARTHASCGTPPPGVTVSICDPESGAPLPDLHVGEVRIAGDSVTRGYWQQDEPAVFVPADRGPQGIGRHLRSGDLGFMHQGALYLCGRIKDLLIIGGVNVHPEDLEQAAARGPWQPLLGPVCAFQIDDGCVVLVAEAQRRQTPPDPAMLAQALRAACGVMPDLLIVTSPKAVVKTTSGKVSRALTRALFHAGKLPVLACFERGVGAAAADDAAGWRQQLELVFARHRVLDRQHTLVEQGLDSLALVELQLALGQVFADLGCPAVGSAFDGPLLQGLSRDDIDRALIPLDRDGIAGESQTVAALQLLRARMDDGVQQRMRSDRLCTEADAPFLARGPTAGRDWLLTGATGFFGPFLLHELLCQTHDAVRVLVRADSPAVGLQRIGQALLDARLLTREQWQKTQDRVQVVCGDLSLPHWGMDAAAWAALAHGVGDLLHNGACVNYVLPYDAMRGANVEGTRWALALARLAGARFHLVSSTFVFGWSARGALLETDRNPGMAALDFGYSQSKWVAEQLAWDAQARGLQVRVYRPALISVSTQGAGDRNDVTVRLLAFMIRHGVAVDSGNQLSLLPADGVARHLVGIARQLEMPPSALHLTTDDCHSLTDLTRAITRLHGYHFRYFDIPAFIGQLNRLCSPRDPIFSLLDFFNRSAEKTAAMQLKRYSNTTYQAARARLPGAWPDPSLDLTASRLVAYLLAQGLVPAPAALGGVRLEQRQGQGQPG